MTDLKKYLPPIYKNSKLMQNIMNANNLEFEKLNAMTEQAFKEIVIDTATEKLSDYEKSLFITPGINDTLADRRSRVKSKMRGYGNITLQQLKSVVESYAKGDVEITEEFSEYTIKIKFINRVGRPDRMDYIDQVVRDTIPAHIAVEYIFIYNTWGAVKDSLTWGEIKENTWDDLLNEVIANARTYISRI